MKQPKPVPRVVLAMNRALEGLERRGWIHHYAGADPDVTAVVPELARLSEHHAEIRAEVVALLQKREKLTRIQDLGGDYTDGGIHTVSWRAFLIKAGWLVEENCRLVPRTAALLRDIPGVYTAFFSILEPGQYITPHFGYYKGFLRYHLGVIVPGGTTERCWLRINPDLEVARARDTGAIEGGSRYHWREGEAFLFDDVLLHDAANESDEIRVVLWLDVRRPLPLPLDLLNRAGLWVAARTRVAEEVRRNGVVAL